MRQAAHALTIILSATLLLPAGSQAASISLQSFNSMAEFQASTLYAFVTGTGGGLSGRKAHGVSSLRQGSSAVPSTSAGAPGNEAVTSEILSAATDVPDVFSLSSTPAQYDKKFVSLGSAASGAPPFITVEIPPASTGPAGGLNGYDIVVFDLGKNLATGTGNQNTEATIFQVELLGDGAVYQVGTISATGGNFINAILLDISGIPGIPSTVDAVRVVDVTGTTNPTSGGLDLDGALTLNPDSSTPTRAASWGAVKTRYR